MIEIREITEPISQLYFNDDLVGDITSHLVFNDCILQIKKQNIEGYSLLYEGQKFVIQPNGRIVGGGVIYPTYSSQMKELMGF